MDTVLFQDHLVICAIKTIPGKAVKFPDENNIKQLLAAVFDHLLELRAIVRFGRECTVNVVLDDRDAVLFGVGSAFPNLPFDGFFTLVVGGVTSIDNSSHRFTSFLTGKLNISLHVHNY